MRVATAHEKIFFAKQELDSLRRKIEGICVELRGKADASTQNRRNHLPVFQVECETETESGTDRVRVALTVAAEQMRQAVAQLEIAFDEQKEGDAENGQAQFGS